MIITRSLFFIGLLLASIFLTPFIFLPLAVFYAYRYFAIELLIGAFLIDVYFGQASEWPLYTLGAFMLILAAEIAKKYIMIQ